MREIIIDSDTRVYYIYEEKKYYIENKDTTTYRFTPSDTLNVLKVITEQEIPLDKDNNPITKDRLIELSTRVETLTSLSYTWADDGSYIATIQLNEFSRYPLAIEPSKSKFYIMNTELVYNLSTNEDPTQRLQYVQNFYYSTLGLFVDISDLQELYNIFLSYYTPFAYNSIASTEDNTVQPKYSNTIKLSNFDNSSPATYTLTFNPSNKSTNTPIGYILSLQDRVITLTENVNTDLIHVGDTLTITNAVTYVDGYPYPANGTYTIADIKDNTITVNENFPTPYQYIPPTLNLLAYKSLIEEISREDNTITCTNNAPLDSFLIGDTIHVKGTEIITDYETLTVDGTYTIQDVQGHKITTEEQPSTNYTYSIHSTGTQPYLYKKIQVADVDTIDNKTIVISTEPTLTLTNSDPVFIIYPNNQEEFTTFLTQENNTIIVSDTLTNFTAEYGVINKPIPSTEVLIEVTDTKSEDVMPNTSFIVDNNAQVTEYLSLMPTLTTPTEACYNKVNQYVESTYTIPETTTGISTMSFKGLSSEVYTKDEIQ